LAALAVAATTTACDPGYSVAVENSSPATWYVRLTDGLAVEVFEAPPGASGYGPQGLGTGARRLEVLDLACKPIWKGSVSTGTFVLTINDDLAVTLAEESVESFVTPLAASETCGSTVPPQAPESSSSAS
jgi:hypothetical protein